MAKVDIISGFLGAGKTTLIKKLLADGKLGEKVVLIENEFGEIGIDGGFLKEAGIQITEMNSGCICCTLVGDFGKALAEVIEKYDPERIIIEPSGVGKLSDVIKAVEDLHNDKISLNSFTAVVDCTKAKMYLKNFGEFFSNQVQYAKTIVLSRTQNVSEEKLDQTVKMLRELNSSATIITTPWDELDSETVMNAMEAKASFEDDLLKEAIEIARKHQEEHAHHHHHDDDDEDEHEHHHHHDDDDDEDEHEHHHHHHDHDEDEDEDEHEHEHHHEHGEGCSCGCHDHHDGHHHADEVFDSWGNEGPKKYTREKLESILEVLSETDDYGMVLRSKGIVPAEDGKWLHFDLTPGEYEIREGAADVTGRLCVIGSKLKENELKVLFEL
ncbi:MAG: GTP-binding protein [Lachnospiraceae bacterium]|nr:GTP-binding protein [Lachnospiraceae bacterium]